MFNAFKEALKPCKATSSSSSSSSSSSQVSQKFESSMTTRKPPKSSLSRQLLRLQEDTDLFPETHLKKCWDEDHSYDGGSAKVDDSTGNERKNPKLEAFQEKKVKKLESLRGEGKSGLGPLQHVHLIGTYEPLLLSLSEEIPVVQVPASINSRLLKHQREGVKFLYNLYKNNHGGILGDDMFPFLSVFLDQPVVRNVPSLWRLGLGKTIQTIAFLAAVFGKEEESDLSNLTLEKQKEIRKKGPVLIICPSSVIINWENEFSNWSTFRVSVYHGPNRDLIIDKLNVGAVEVLITSFDTFRIQGSVLSDIDWEIVVVDEAHRLKNEKSKLYASCIKIRTPKRYGLTGTIMQNKIMELFNLFDWVVPGGLGTREHFREFYDEPLKHGQRSTAPERFIRVADERKQHLVSILSKYMLRRTKEETIGHLMMGKEDNVVFCAMSDLQKRVYQRTLQLPDFQCLINKDLACSCGSPLKQVECCNRTVPNGLIWPYLHRDNQEGCDSCPFCLVLPCLIKLQQISNHLELIKPNPKDDQDKQRKDEEFASAVFGDDDRLVGGGAQNDSFMALSDVAHCGKMRALEKLTHSWISKGDKILLFSYSVRMLNILEKFIIRKGYSFSRLDGSTPTGLRQSLVDDFNSSPSKQVFLISTRAGGLGLNLVSANRVVIFDPNWNPAQDLQAQDRSFRFGQKRHVTVFRLLAAGSLEELVYTRQVYKQQLSNIAVSGKMEKRYFEGVQDCKQFQGELFGISNLFRDLSNKAFTSEIVESRDLRGEDDRLNSSVKLDLTGFCSSDGLGNNEETSSTSGLEDLGIVYAHRNEDVVNFGSKIQVEARRSIHLNISSKEKPHDIRPDDQAKEEEESSVPNEVGEEDNNFEVSADSSKRRRSDSSCSDNSSLIALLLGMKEGELNKILHP